MDDFTAELLRKEIPVKFIGMCGTDYSPNVTLTVNLRELHQLIEAGDVVVQAKRVRPCLIKTLANG